MTSGCLRAQDPRPGGNKTRTCYRPWLTAALTFPDQRL
jgi:hypothetical protein